METDEDEEAGVELERCVNCGSEFDAAGERLSNECEFHPGMHDKLSVS